MKSYRKELWFNTKNRIEFINITPEVNQCLKESGVREGIVLVNTKNRIEFINITPEVNQCLKESGVREGIVLVNAKHI